MSQLASMMEQVRKLKNGIGMQRLLDEASKILGNPIAMFNTEYNLTAYTPCTTDDPIWNELIRDGTFSQKTQELFYYEGFVEEMANTPSMAFLISKKLKYDRICGKVFSKNNTHISNLVIVACNRTFEEHDPVVFEAICRLMSREISKSASFQEYEQVHQEAIIRSLLDGTHDIKLDLGQMGILYDSLASNLYLAVVDISGSDLQSNQAAYYRDMLMQIEPAYKYTLYRGSIVIILSTNEDMLHVNRALSSLIQAFDRHNMYAGLSNRFENLLELQKYYIQALEAMDFTRDTRSNQRIFPCNPDSVEKMKRIKRLAGGEGIQHYLDTGAEIFGNPLLFHDMELNLLGYSQNYDIIDPIWEELITYGTSSDETINLFKTEGFVNTMERTKGGAILSSDKIKYDRISWRIYSHDNIMIGCVSIVDTHAPFTDDELVLFGAFGQRFSKEVSKLEVYTKYGRVYSGTVINRLLSGKLDNYTFYSEDIGNLYNNLMDNLFLVAIDTSESQAPHINLTYFRDLFNWPGTVNRYALYGDYIIVIMSIEGPSLHESTDFNELSRVFEQNDIYAGISSCFNDIYDLPKYYIEAVEALTEGKQNNKESGKQWVFHYADTAACS